MNSGKIDIIKNTSHKVVLPFYGYAAFSFLVATLLIFFSSSSFLGFYFEPHILAITHVLALGWATMMILGVSYQLIPVLIEAPLFSNLLSYLSFVLAALGIPILVYSFYVFELGNFAIIGGLLINFAFLFYLINVAITIGQSKTENIHAVFIFTSIVWLMITAIVGLLLLLNFSHFILPEDSLYYLSLHAHLGILGWFLMLIIGVSSRLLPMFLISQYVNNRLLWTVFVLINLSILGYTYCVISSPKSELHTLSFFGIFLAIILFLYYSYMVFKTRIRKKISETMGLSLLSVLGMSVPLIVLTTIVLSFSVAENFQIELVYGCSIFLVCITTLILGMTFKTLPFIVWTKEYQEKIGDEKTPIPVDLYSQTIFNVMAVIYLLGLIVFIFGVFIAQALLLKIASAMMLIAALLYNWNVLKILLHKPNSNDKDR